MLRSRPQPRPGFTIVELMVAAAVCVVIMTIMATCFQIGIDTMRHLKSTGDMAEQLRSASSALRRDLAGDQDKPTEHFLNESGKPNGGVLVSNQRLDLFDPALKTGWAAPRGGFFRVRSFAGTAEGDDGQVSSSRGDGVGAAGNLLHLTAALSGKSDADFYYAAVTDPTTGQLKTYRSRAAEVAYFLDPTPRGKTSNGPAGLNTYQLVRRQRLVAKTDAEKAQLPSSSSSNPAMKKDEPSVIALKPAGGGLFEPCSMADLAADSSLRLGGLNGVPLAVTDPTASDSALAPVFQATTRIGDDVLASNVLSFEVKLIWTPGAGEPSPRGFGPPTGPAPNNNTDHPADSIQQASQAAGQNPVKVEFDTRIDAATGKPPLAVRVKAVQIRLRVWDPKLQSGRQATFLFDL